MTTVVNAGGVDGPWGPREQAEFLERQAPHVRPVAKALLELKLEKSVYDEVLVLFKTNRESMVFEGALKSMLAGLTKYQETVMRKRTFVVRGYLDPALRQVLTLARPEVDLKFEEDGTKAPHALAMVARQIDRFVQKSLIPENARVLEVGGYPSNLIFEGLVNWAVAAPCLDYRDGIRAANWERTEAYLRGVGARKFRGSRKVVWEEYLANPDKFYIREKAENIVGRSFDYVFLQHSMYDVGMDNLVKIMRNTGAKAAVGSLVGTRKCLVEEKGTIPALNARYERVGDEIVFGFVDDPSFTYVHSFHEYRKLFFNRLIYDSYERAGRMVTDAYCYRVTAEYAGAVYFEMTRLSNDVRYRPVSAPLYVDIDKGNWYHITGPWYDSHRSEMVRVAYHAPKQLVDNLRCMVLTRDGVQLEELVNYARAQNVRFVVNGVAIKAADVLAQTYLQHCSLICWFTAQQHAKDMRGKIGEVVDEMHSLRLSNTASIFAWRPQWYHGLNEFFSSLNGVVKRWMVANCGGEQHVTKIVEGVDFVEVYDVETPAVVYENDAQDVYELDEDPADFPDDPLEMMRILQSMMDVAGPADQIAVGEMIDRLTEAHPGLFGEGPQWHDCNTQVCDSDDSDTCSLFSAREELVSDTSGEEFDAFDTPAEDSSGEAHYTDYGTDEYDPDETHDDDAEDDVYDFAVDDFADDGEQREEHVGTTTGAEVVVFQEAVKEYATICKTGHDNRMAHADALCKLTCGQNLVDKESARRVAAFCAVVVDPNPENARKLTTEKLACQWLRVVDHVVVEHLRRFPVVINYSWLFDHTARGDGRKVQISRVKVDGRMQWRAEVANGWYFTYAGFEIENSLELYRGVRRLTSDPFLYVPPVRRAVYGVPGCGKTYQIVQMVKEFVQRDVLSFMVLVAAKVAKEDTLRELLRVYKDNDLLSDLMKARVRTLDSFTLRPDASAIETVLIDECTMAHSGQVVACLSYLKPQKVIALGDSQQMHYVNFVSNKVDMRYGSALTFTATEWLYDSYRLSVAAASALLHRYEGKIRATGSWDDGVPYAGDLRVIKCDKVQDVPLPTVYDPKAKLYLTFSQADKALLISRGYCVGHVNTQEHVCMVRTIVEAEGNTALDVVVYRSEPRNTHSIYLEDGRVTVALSRAKRDLHYYTANTQDKLSMWMYHGLDPEGLARARGDYDIFEGGSRLRNARRPYDFPNWRTWAYTASKTFYCL